MEHICHFPSSFCCISFNCMCQGIHTCGSCKSLWHRGHHIRVNNCDNRHVMWVNTNEFSLSFNICDNVVDCNLSSCSGCCWNCDDRNTRFCCRCNTFKASYIFKFRVCDDDTDCFGSIHRRTTTDCNDVICISFLECFYSVLYIFDCWVCFDIRINFVSKSIFIKNICYFLCNSEFDQIRVRTYKSFLKCSCFCFCSDLFDCACSMIRCFI